MNCVFSLLFCNQGRLSYSPRCFQCPTVQLLHILLLLCGWVISLPQRASGFPRGSAGKESACNVRDLGLIPGLGRSSREGKGYPLQFCGLDNSTDCLVHGFAKSWTRLSDLHSLRELQVGLGEGAGPAFSGVTQLPLCPPFVISQKQLSPGYWAFLSYRAPGVIPVHSDRKRSEGRNYFEVAHLLGVICPFHVAKQSTRAKKMTPKWMLEFEIMTPSMWGMRLTQPGCAVEPGPSTFNGLSPGIFNLIHFPGVSTQL